MMSQAVEGTLILTGLSGANGLTVVQDWRNFLDTLQTVQLTSKTASFSFAATLYDWSCVVFLPFLSLMCLNR